MKTNSLQEKFLPKRLVWFNPESFIASEAEKPGKKVEYSTKTARERKESPYETKTNFIKKLENAEIAPFLKVVLDTWIQTNLQGTSLDAYRDNIKEMMKNGDQKKIPLSFLEESTEDIYANKKSGAKTILDINTGLPKGMLDELKHWALTTEGASIKEKIHRVFDRIEEIAHTN